MAIVYTQAQLDALTAAIASGVTTVSYQGKSVTYRDLNEMRLMQTIMEASITGVPTQRRFTPISFKHL